MLTHPKRHVDVAASRLRPHRDPHTLGTAPLFGLRGGDCCASGSVNWSNTMLAKVRTKSDTSASPSIPSRIAYAEPTPTSPAVMAKDHVESLPEGQLEHQGLEFVTEDDPLALCWHQAPPGGWSAARSTATRLAAASSAQWIQTSSVTSSTVGGKRAESGPGVRHPSRITASGHGQSPDAHERLRRSSAPRREIRGVPAAGRVDDLNGA